MDFFLAFSSFFGTIGGEEALACTPVFCMIHDARCLAVHPHGCLHRTSSRSKGGFRLRQKLNFLINPFLVFLRWESSSGILLLLCAAFALILANSPMASTYEHWQHFPVAILLGDFSLQMGLLHWINDGLMAVFFFAIGLEVKREFLCGELQSLQASLLPITAAICGIVCPALLYYAINFGAPSVDGWGIPMATDIAFALGTMTLAARSAPLGLVVFLTALAIVDDLGAILVIALFYTSNLSVSFLLFGLLAILGAYLCNRLAIRYIGFYLIFGIAAWLSFYQAGIHPTIAGVLLGFTIPMNREDAQDSMLHSLEHQLEPWSAFFIMPLFAFFNAGVAISLDTFSLDSPIFLGIVIGLCLGKPLGIAGSVLALHKGFSMPLPGGAQKGELVATGMVGGIGFTMSIFIASLAFEDPAMLAQAKISILAASILSGLLGATAFKLLGRR